MARSVNIEQEFDNIFILLGLVKKKLDHQLEIEVRWRGYKDFKAKFLPVLILLYKDASTIKLVSEKLEFTKQAGSLLVNEMITKGYIKTLINKQDRRSTLILLSAKGKRLAVEARKCYLKLLHNYSNLIGFNKYQNMLDALDTLKVLHD